MPKFYDLTHIFQEDTLLFPGTPPLRFKSLNTIPANGFAETQLTLTSHVGTHIDAPAHLIPGGKTLGDFSAEKFWGMGYVVNCQECTREISQPWLAVQLAEKWPLDFVLLATGHSRHWPAAAYLENFPVLSPAAARWLVRQNIQALGMDAISFDPVESTALPVHHILLGAEILLVENLKIPAVLLNQSVEIVLAPLNFRRADGAPVRVFVKTEN
jgi:kynurenine formamidase